MKRIISVLLLAVVAVSVFAETITYKKNKDNYYTTFYLEDDNNIYYSEGNIAFSKDNSEDLPEITNAYTLFITVGVNNIIISELLTETVVEIPYTKKAFSNIQSKLKKGNSKDIRSTISKAKSIESTDDQSFKNMANIYNMLEGYFNSQTEAMLEKYPPEIYLL